jgi:hypothetical protein
MDEEIVTGSGIPEGDPHLLTIDKQGDHLEIGTQHISFIGLHRVVSGLHSVGLAIIQALPTSKPSVDA